MHMRPLSPVCPAFCEGADKDGWPPRYGMLPRSTHTRSAREAAKGKQQIGAAQEIQRLIGRSLRAIVDSRASRRARRSLLTATCFRQMAALEPHPLRALCCVGRCHQGDAQAR
jgi:hypothetical protein